MRKCAGEDAPSGSSVFRTPLPQRLLRRSTFPVPMAFAEPEGRPRDAAFSVTQLVGSGAAAETAAGQGPETVEVVLSRPTGTCSFGLDFRGNLVVDRVEPGGLADGHGIESGWQLVSCNRQEVVSARDLRRLVKGLLRVVLVFLRPAAEAPTQQHHAAQCAHAAKQSPEAALTTPPVAAPPPLRRLGGSPPQPQRGGTPAPGPSDGARRGAAPQDGPSRANGGLSPPPPPPLLPLPKLLPPRLPKPSQRPATPPPPPPQPQPPPLSNGSCGGSTPRATRRLLFESPAPRSEVAQGPANNATPPPPPRAASRPERPALAAQQSSGRPASPGAPAPPVGRRGCDGAAECAPAAAAGPPDLSARTAVPMPRPRTDETAAGGRHSAPPRAGPRAQQRAPLPVVPTPGQQPAASPAPGGRHPAPPRAGPRAQQRAPLPVVPTPGQQPAASPAPAPAAAPAATTEAGLRTDPPPAGEPPRSSETQVGAAPPSAAQHGGPGADGGALVKEELQELTVIGLPRGPFREPLVEALQRRIRRITGRLVSLTVPIAAGCGVATLCIPVSVADIAELGGVVDWATLSEELKRDPCPPQPSAPKRRRLSPSPSPSRDDCWSRRVFKRPGQGLGLRFSDCGELRLIGCVPGSPAAESGCGGYVGHRLTHVNGFRVDTVQDCHQLGLRDMTEVLLTFTAAPRP
eukprot:TRINITY_DN1527_c3_g1_i5.p1 TRINITY_DN1527_c3_g1~~TRINITY_DN1527_c3_g1_i5.p1  ORF type:complete len:688 (+),score=80.31 TRINITY_DN1527_c3_g1_i5:78-2141(+)